MNQQCLYALCSLTEAGALKLHSSWGMKWAYSVPVVPLALFSKDFTIKLTCKIPYSLWHFISRQKQANLSLHSGYATRSLKMEASGAGNCSFLCVSLGTGGFKITKPSMARLQRISQLES